MWHGHRRIGITSSTLGQLDRAWLNNNLPLAKIHINMTLVLVCGCEVWMIITKDDRRLKAFHVRCQRHILCIRSWSDCITYDYASSRPTTGLWDICGKIVYRRHILSGTPGTSHKTRPRRAPSSYVSMPLRKESSSWLKASTLSPVQ